MYAYPRGQRNLTRYDRDEVSALPLTEANAQIKHTADKLADYRRINDTLIDFLPEKGRLVEVGSFSGVLTDYFRQAGWDAAGIEPDGRAVAYARTIYGVEVHCGTLETVDLPPGSADAIVMLHVIEHVDDPMANVRSAHSLLRQGGVFAVETPTYDSLSYRILRHRERSISCDGHIFFYTEKTLKDLLIRAGFKVVRIERVGRTMSIDRFLWNVAVVSKSNGAKNAVSNVSKKLHLDSKYLYVNLGDMIRIYASKL
jgi:SAM-dependent methyltransferase